MSNYFKFLFYLVPLLSFSQNCDLFSNQNCLENLDEYYFFEKILLKDQCKKYLLDSKERVDLKNNLAQSIVSFIESKNSLEQGYVKDKKGFSETQIYNSFSQSNSSAILFNPQFSSCKRIIDGVEVNSVYVYIKKNSFNEMTVNFFKSLTDRLKNALRLNNYLYKNNPKYDFFEEIIQMEASLNTLSSYFGLMVSLNIEKKYIDDFFELENDFNFFKEKIDSFENLLNKSNYNQAFDLLNKYNTLHRNTFTNNIIDNQIKIYNQSVSRAKSNKLEEFKNKSISYNNFTMELTMNSALINNFKGGSGTLNYNTNSTFDRIYPSLESRFVFNDREHRYGFGPYFKFHFSKLLFRLKNIPYIFPFSNSFPEAGLFGQYFFVKDRFNESICGIILSAGKLFDNFVTETGENLNFLVFSTGIKSYLQSNNLKKYRTSITIRYNLMTAGSQYSYNNFSIGFSRNIKVGQKISDLEKQKLENDYKIFK